MTTAMAPHPPLGWSHHTTYDHLVSVDGDEAEALKDEAWALDALAERGYFNERLDQLLVDVLLGVR